MKALKFGSKFILRIDRGEEIIGAIKKFCEENNIRLGTFSGIGSTNKAVVGLFDPETKKYHSKEFNGNYEIAPLTGNISTMNGAIYIHVHANLCDASHNSFGGHLNSAVVSATFEAVVDVIDGVVEREFSDFIGLNLYRI